MTALFVLSRQLRWQNGLCRNGAYITMKKLLDELGTVLI